MSKSRSGYLYLGDFRYRLPDPMSKFERIKQEKDGLDVSRT